MRTKAYFAFSVIAEHDRDLERMASQEAVFKLIYNAAKCFIPRDELSQAQLERLCNITLRSCRCRECRRYEYLGHTDKSTLEISWSQPFVSHLLTYKDLMDGLFLTVGMAVHEIVHVLFPDYTEEQTRRKACDWLKKNLWLEAYKAQQSD